MTHPVGLERENFVQQIERFIRAAGSAQDQRQVCAGRRPGGRKLDRPPKQLLRIAHPADASGKLGKHPHRPNVERIFLQMRLQQALGDVETIFVERHRRLHQPRMQMCGFVALSPRLSRSPPLPLAPS